ncbi:calcium-binding protein [Thalassococcus lentus]|uniref:Calcium-binding protein n=1 Tax=Thalassococcus lentus TaxID=1210524 RepID=A0ABT4XT77_9RHOB|nr:calcium-binding protein [Thalassococcus lentus]MDA7425090.1 calcium-binding protein [Thalassococcus lentus]
MLASLLFLSLMGSVALVGVQTLMEEPDDTQTDEVEPEPLTPPEDVPGNTHQGGVRANDYAGRSDDDWLAGGRGMDTIEGRAGDDTLFGEQGRDLLLGGSGNDLLEGGGWHDALGGGDGNDVLRGGGGMDTLAGGDGDDTLQGEAWNDLLVGGGGSDLLQGGAGNDILLGHGTSHPEMGQSDINPEGFHEALEAAYAQSETLGSMTEAELQSWAEAEAQSFLEAYSPPALGADGADTLNGGEGDDIIYLGDDADLAFGGSGHDTFVVNTWSPDLDISSDAAPIIQDFGAGSDGMVVEYYADTEMSEPDLTVDTLENGDQVLRADGAALVYFVQPATPVRVEDITLVAVMPATAA